MDGHVHVDAQRARLLMSINPHFYDMDFTQAWIMQWDAQNILFQHNLLPNSIREGLTVDRFLDQVKLVFEVYGKNDEVKEKVAKKVESIRMEVRERLSQESSFRLKSMESRLSQGSSFRLKSMEEGNASKYAVLQDTGTKEGEEEIDDNESIPAAVYRARIQKIQSNITKLAELARDAGADPVMVQALLYENSNDVAID